ncbi:amino acid ABC transporter permease [Alicyclobacillus mengziensis]|uniref:Amino acid ABC transporter permease n=1 Tax=Alicyclobacillus mengziensis TaxID=2931921 RepID=A0A9X7VXP9_9BACL|nr:amino acid ABC transporter permease [Alicyclobacillus mengziensis]QSO46792.1 amino acid ABC transporter permease [Alicyclobacillus mengziensis]
MHVAELYIGSIAIGALKDFILTVVSTLVSLILGILFAALRLYGNFIIKAVIGWYVEIIRGLPAILQLFIIFFGLNQIGIRLSPLTAGLIWLVAYGSGYAVEIFRSGIMDVADGQREAAAALGLNWWTMMRKVVMPQAFAVMLPALTSFVVLQLKNTTMLYLVGYADIMYQARLGTDATDAPGVLYLMSAIAYLVMSLIIGIVGNRMEKRVAAYR